MSELSVNLNAVKKIHSESCAGIANETQLMHRVATGEETAFVELIALHNDSLSQLIGRLTAWHTDSEDILQEGQLRLHRVPGAMNDGVHLAWHHRAGKLLGLPREYHGSDYVGQLITWRRSNLAALQQHIEDTTGKPWVRAVSRSLRFSEYILYGSFVEHVLDPSEARHFFTDEDLCHCCWFREDAEALRSGEDHPADSAVALLVQSNLELSPTAEQAIHDAALLHAKCLA